MKRNIYLLTFIMSLFSLSVFSQSMTLLNHGTIIPNNDTITCDFDTISVDNEFDNIDIKNNTSQDLNDVWVKKVYLNVWPNTWNTICWGSCVTPEVFRVGPWPISANATSTEDFAFHYNPQGQTGGSIIRYVFYLASNPSDSVCFNVKFRHPLDVGINEMYKNYLFTNAYPNPANNIANINYSYSSEVNNASIVLNDLLGKVVKEIPLSNNQGKVTINTADIPNGIYLYSLQLNGITVNTRKLIVNH